MQQDSLVHTTAPAWQSGLEAQPRTVQPGLHSGFLLAITVIFVLIAFNFRHLSRVLRGCAEQLTRGRRGRSNVFDEHPAGDVRIILMLTALGVFSSGIMLGGHIARSIGIRPDVEILALTTGIMTLWYCLTLAACTAVGHTFTHAENANEWTRSLNASQAILGVALLFPALLGVFYPNTFHFAFIVGLILYAAARMLFIFKGFRIFYNKIGSLLYFILYLCTLEIIPLIFVYNSSSMLVIKTL